MPKTGFIQFSDLRFGVFEAVAAGPDVVHPAKLPGHKGRGEDVCQGRLGDLKTEAVQHPFVVNVAEGLGKLLDAHLASLLLLHVDHINREVYSQTLNDKLYI